MASNQQNPSEATATMHRLLAGGRVVHVIRTAAELGLADHLEDDRPLDVQSISAATSTHAPSLARILRALAAIGIVHETEDRQYTLTPLGTALRTKCTGLHASVGSPRIR
jgi:DNA-binding HxlR family transcriptional regulator